MLHQIVVIWLVLWRGDSSFGTEENDWLICQEINCRIGQYASSPLDDGRIKFDAFFGIGGGRFPLFLASMARTEVVGDRMVVIVKNENQQINSFFTLSRLTFDWRNKHSFLNLSQLQQCNA